MKAIILAAGYATRLYPLTKDKPKALLIVKNRPIIDYIVDELNTVDSIDEIIVISNDKFHGHFDAWAKTVSSPCPVTVLNDGTKTEETRLGAIGDIFFTVEKTGIEDDICVIASDNLFTYRVKDVYDFFSQTGNDCVVVKKIDDRELLKSFAVVKVDAENTITELKEKPSEPQSDLAAFANYFYKKETVPLLKRYLDEGNKPDAPGHFVEWLYRRKPVKAYIMDGECYDIGTLEALEKANETFDLGR